MGGDRYYSDQCQPSSNVPQGELPLDGKFLEKQLRAGKPEVRHKIRAKSVHVSVWRSNWNAKAAGTDERSCFTCCGVNAHCFRELGRRLRHTLERTLRLRVSSALHQCINGANRVRRAGEGHGIGLDAVCGVNTSIYGDSHTISIVKVVTF